MGNQLLWFFSKLTFIGGILGNYTVSGIYTTNSAGACEFIAKNSRAEVIILENKSQYQKYANIKDGIKLIIMTLESDSGLKSLDPRIKTWDEIMKIGRQTFVKNKTELDKRMSKQNPSTICCVVYTSGTTGNPKGVMLTHDNMTYVATEVQKQYFKYINKDRVQDRMVSYLPFSHVLGIYLDLINTIMAGMQIFFAKPDALQGSLLETLKEVRPTVFVAVPRVYEKIEEKINAALQKKKPIAKTILNFAFKAGEKASMRRLANKKAPLGYNIVDSLVMKKIKKEIGLDKTLLFLVGAAPIQKRTQNFFASLNTLVLSMYGLSEACGPCTTSLIPPYKLHTVGIGVPGTEIKILNPSEKGEGEVCIRGRGVFAGYLGNLEETMKAFDNDRFFHSGDSGILDIDGHLELTGRIKELIKTSGGEYVSPVPIEDRFLQACKLCSNIILIGEQQNYVSALITIKGIEKQEGDRKIYELTKECLKVLDEIGSPAATIDEVMRCTKVKQYIDQCISIINKKATNRVQQIRKWAILPRDFTISHQEITPTLKLRRKEIQKNFCKVIDGIYKETKL